MTRCYNDLITNILVFLLFNGPHHFKSFPPDTLLACTVGLSRPTYQYSS
jgi:hypothetical protein